MAKKKKENVILIDHIPESCRQRRSHPRRRTDFSTLFSASFHGGSLSRSSGSKDILLSFNIASLDETMEKRTKMTKFPLIKYNNSEDKGLCSDAYEVPIDEVESVVVDAHFDSSNDRTFHERKDDNAKTLDFMPITSQAIKSSGAFSNPGSIVWAKTACQIWWPAEVMEDKSTDSRNQGIDGHVLIQYYGSHHSAWVDPDRDLSLFQDCFEERSCNPMEDFQDALQQALHKMRHLNSCGQLVGSPDGTDNLGQQDQSFEKCNSLCSSRTEDDSIERGRGKRKRKPKVHFDAATCPRKPARKVRRFRIMRYLGLKAPVGSPFSVAHARIASK